MLHLLKRHPFPVKAFFRQSLVLTYAFPRELLQSLLPPGLALDAHRGYGFLAIALVQTHRLHPSFLPAALGRDVFLSGYRIFVRLGNGAGSLRGLRILRSYSDRRWMVVTSNVFTHYKYRLCEANLSERPGEIEWTIQTPDQQADLRVIAWTMSDPSLSQRDRRSSTSRTRADLQVRCRTHSTMSQRLTRSSAFTV